MFGKQPCRTKFYAIALVSAAWLLAIYAETAKADYVLARAPQSSAANLSAAWMPFLERLSKEVGVQITLRLYPSRQAFEHELYAGIPDFAFMNPYYAVLVRKQFGYNALVRDDAQKLKGVIVVTNDSSIKTVADLQGKTIAFADVNAMGASLLPRAVLTRDHGISFNAVYVGPHENVYRAVFAKQVDAGAGVPQTLDAESEDLRKQLRIVFETPEMPSHPLIAHPRVPIEVQEKVTESILHFRNDAAGRALLKGVKLSQPTVVNFANDYGRLETLHLEQFVSESEE